MKLNNNLRDTIDAAADQQEQRNGRVAAYAELARSGQFHIDGIDPAYRDAVRRYLAGNSGVEMTPQQFHAKQEAERRKFFRDRTAQGHKAHRVSQPDHDYIIENIFDSVDAGTKPAVRPLLKAYGAERGYAPGWADRVSGKAQPKKMARTLAAKKNHPVFKDLKEGHMLSQTHKAALKNATYSGLAELLFNGSQIIRSQRPTQDRMAALEAELAMVKAEAARANARLDIKDAGMNWKETTRAIRVAEPAIPNRELARRVGMHESTVRKYLNKL